MLSSATGTNIIIVLISELYIVSVKCQVFGYRSVKSSSLRCSNCREVNKKRERRHATYRQTRRLGVIGWTSADTLVWNVFGFWLFVYLPLPVVLLASAAASLLPLGRVLRLAFWTHLVLNAVVKSRAVAAVCGFLNLVSIYFCIHGRSGWRRGGEAGLSTCESLSVTYSRSKTKSLHEVSWYLWGLRGHVNLSSAVSCYKYTDTITSVSL